MLIFQLSYLLVSSRTLSSMTLLFIYDFWGVGEWGGGQELLVWSIQCQKYDNCEMLL